MTDGTIYLFIDFENITRNFLSENIDDVCKGDEEDDGDCGDLTELDNIRECVGYCFSVASNVDISLSAPAIVFRNVHTKPFRPPPSALSRHKVEISFALEWGWRIRDPINEYCAYVDGKIIRFRDRTAEKPGVSAFN